MEGTGGLQSAEPERGSGRERTGFVKAQKEGQAEQQEDRSLAEDDAEQRGRKAISNPVEAAAGMAEDLP